MKNKIESFSQKIKKEITELSFKKCCLNSLLKSFLLNNRVIILNGPNIIWRLSSQFEFIIDFLDKSLKTLFNINTNKFSTIESFKKTFYLNIDASIEDKIKINNLDNVVGDSKNQCCYRAFVTGLFLSGGSISSIKDKKCWYHLELRSFRQDYLIKCQEILISFKIFPVLAKRNNQFILYIKKVNEISDFLKLINAVNNYFEFEDLKIKKDYTSQITRLNNLDVSNLNKSIISGIDQIKKINVIQKKDIYQLQTKKLKVFCEARKKYPDYSLSKIVNVFANEYNIKTTKSCLNHICRKINKIYNDTNE